MINDFADETRNLFSWSTECWWCRMSHADSLHHILGRVSDSSLNAAPINNLECHIGNGKLLTFGVKQKFLKKTFNYLLENHYQLTEKDKKFKQKYSKYYE